MTEIHALAPREATSLPSSSEWRTMVEMAGMLVPTGFLPNTIKTAEQAVAIILKGRELRVPPMYALSNIVVVQGKPTCSAELMLALIYRDQGDDAVVVEESTATACRLTYKRRTWAERRPFAFSIEDARTAGLAGKDTWKSYPQAMLRARCVSAVARLAFPDSIAGMYTPEELGASVRVTEDGAVEVDQAPPAPGPRERPGPAGSTVVREGGTDFVFGYGRDQEPSGPSPRMAAVAQEMAAAVAEGDAIVQGAEPAGVPGDDVDELIGMELLEACQRMTRRLNAQGVEFAPLPATRTNNALRQWWKLAAAALAAQP
jgi:hypothetical protein